MSRLELTGSRRRTAATAGPRARRLTLRFWKNANGATAIEYGLVVGLIFLAIVGALRLYADRVTAMYSYISSAIVKSS